MPTDESKSAQRPWAISRRPLIISVTLAILTELLFLAALVTAIFFGQANIGVVTLPILWPLYYAALYGLCFGIAAINEKDGITSYLPPPMQRFFPPISASRMGWLYPKIPNFALISFPVFAVLISTLVFWSALTKQLHG
jgi:hypothetical protein